MASQLRILSVLAAIVAVVTANRNQFRKAGLGPNTDLPEGLFCSEICLDVAALRGRTYHCFLYSRQGDVRKFLARQYGLSGWKFYYFDTNTKHNLLCHLAQDADAFTEGDGQNECNPIVRNKKRAAEAEMSSRRFYPRLMSGWGSGGNAFGDPYKRAFAFVRDGEKLVVSQNSAQSQDEDHTFFSFDAQSTPFRQQAAEKPAGMPGGILSGLFSGMTSGLLGGLFGAFPSGILGGRPDGGRDFSFGFASGLPEGNPFKFYNGLPNVPFPRPHPMSPFQPVTEFRGIGFGRMNSMSGGLAMKKLFNKVAAPASSGVLCNLARRQLCKKKKAVRCNYQNGCCYVPINATQCQEIIQPPKKCYESFSAMLQIVEV